MASCGSAPRRACPASTATHQPGAPYRYPHAYTYSSSIEYPYSYDRADEYFYPDIYAYCYTYTDPD